MSHKHDFFFIILNDLKEQFIQKMYICHALLSIIVI